jgi:hypothetical protein
MKWIEHARNRDKWQTFWKALVSTKSGNGCSLNMNRKIKSRTMRWLGHVVRMGEMTNAYRIVVGKPEGKTPPPDLGVDDRMN